MPCKTCLHARVRHIRDDELVACRLTGCQCKEYVDPVIAVDSGAREVTITVPDGYMLSISLVPYTSEATDADD